MLKVNKKLWWIGLIVILVVISLGTYQSINFSKEKETKEIIEEVSLKEQTTELDYYDGQDKNGNLLGRQKLTNEKGETWIAPSEGIKEYKVAQAEEAWPKFRDVIIDPLKVSVGQFQKMKVELENTVAIKSVVAFIKTDNQILEVPLKLTERRMVTKKDIENRKYFVQNNKLVVIDPSQSMWTAALGVIFKEAGAANLERFIYEGEWFVHDTHEITYHTKFVATDELDRTNEVVMAWSDPCSPAFAGTWSISADNACPDGGIATGPDNAGINITAGTLTTGTNTTIVWGPSSSITLSGTGKITIGTGAKLLQSRMYICMDTDADGYADGAIWMKSLTNTGGCQYGSIYGAVTSINVNDCSSGNAAIWVNRSCYDDNDNDDYGTGSGHSVCTGASCISGATLHASNSSDCYDGNVNAKPGQGSYYNTHRGDSSFDYNCDSSIQYQYSVPTVGQCYNTVGNFVKRVGDTEYYEYCGYSRCGYKYWAYNNWEVHYGGTTSGCIKPFSSWTPATRAAYRH